MSDKNTPNEGSALVLREDRDGIAILTLNRPDQLNALSPNLFVELRQHLEQIADAPEEVGCVILRGAGRAFSAGNDLKAIQRGETAPDPYFQADTLRLIETLPQPVIASVHGHCYTGALELVLACDLTICSSSARFADTHGRWAMTPTWGMSQRLPRRVGPLIARDLMYTGRTLEGDEAVRYGIANQSCLDEELERMTFEWASQIVANSWHTLRADKMLIRGGLERTLDDGLRFEREQSPGRGPDMEERLQAFQKKS